MKKKFFIGFFIILSAILISIVLVSRNKAIAESRQDGVIYFDRTLLTQSLPGDGTITYIASSSSRDVTTKISGSMVQDTNDKNIFKTDQSIPTTYDYIQFYYTSSEDNAEYTSGLLTIDNSLSEPCFYSYAFLSLQQSIAEQIEYKTYKFDPSDMEVQTIETPIQVGTYVEETESDTSTDEGTTTTEKPFSINAGAADSSRDVLVQDIAVSFDNGVSVSKRIHLRGKGTSEYRSISFETKGSADVTIGISAASDTTDRPLAIYSSDGKIVDWVTVTASSTFVKTFTIDNPGEYYISSASGGIGIGYVEVKEYYTPIFNGAWKNLNSTNTPQEKIDDIDKGTYTKDSSGSTYYANINMYDYYSDWELAGNSLKDITVEDQYNYYNLQGYIYSKAISDYFKSLDTDGNANPLYFGGLKKEDNGMAILENILYNAVNSGNVTSVSAAVQGLVETILNSNDKVTLSGIELPYFNKEFLEGNNSLNTALGKVYENVEFPFVMNKETGYWEFMSSDENQTVRLKEDTSTGKYFFDIVGADEAVWRFDKPNFFPLTSGMTSDAGQESKKNNLFGMEMEIQFSLTENGKINFYDENGEIVAKDIMFNFSGDDDVWIYIDDKLVLDIGGTHQEIAGAIDFATGYSAITYATTDGATATGNSDVATFQTATSDGILPENIVTEDGNTYLVYNDIKYPANSFDKDALLDGQIHTLKMFYMERGSFSSNMKIAFNFPIQDSLEVSNKVDTSKANDIFKDALANLPDFNFEIKTMATIGNPLPVEDVPGKVGFETDDTQISDYNSISESNTSNGLQPVSGINYTKTSSNGDTSENQITDGKTIINNEESILFTDSFRTGSYIQVKESIQENLKDAFLTTWQIKQGGAQITTTGTGNSTTTTGTDVSGTGYIADDNRSPSSSYISVDNVTRPSDGAIVYRNYDSPDAASKIELQVEYVNTLQVGSITLEKQVLGDNPNTDYEYEFLVEFTNIAGANLEQAPITQSVKLKHGESITLSGIPVGTDYKITEVIDMALQEIQVENNIHNNISTENLIATGTIAINGEVDNQKFTFVNNDITKGYGKIEITKVDKNNKELKLEGATFRLEKLVLDSGTNEWIVDTSFTAIEKTTNQNGYTEFNNLDLGKYRISEIKAPEGYNLTNETVDVDITIDNILVSFTFENKEKLELPSAGENKGFYIAIAGVVIFLFAIKFFKKPRKQAKRRKSKHSY